MSTKPRAARPARRRASLALELLLLLPVLLLVALAVVEFALVVGARERLTAACREGARCAARGCDEEEVERAVRFHLGDGTMRGAAVEAVLRDKETGRPFHCGEAVEVYVAVHATDVVPDLLGWIGLSLCDEVLVAHAVMRKE